jgi:hypothetical protein
MPVGFGPGMFFAPVLMARFDTDRNGRLARAELVQGFERWFRAWDADKTNALTEAQVRVGLNKIFTPPGPGFGPPGFGPPGPGFDPGFGPGPDPGFGPPGDPGMDFSFGPDFGPPEDTASKKSAPKEPASKKSASDRGKTKP